MIQMIIAAGNVVIAGVVTGAAVIVVAKYQITGSRAQHHIAGGGTNHSLC